MKAIRRIKEKFTTFYFSWISVWTVWTTKYVL